MLLIDILLYPVKIKSEEYNNIDPCPADKTNLSLFSQFGFFGLNLRKYLNRIVDTSAIPSAYQGDQN